MLHLPHCFGLGTFPTTVNMRDEELSWPKRLASGVISAAIPKHCNWSLASSTDLPIHESLIWVLAELLRMLATGARLGRKSEPYSTALSDQSTTAAMKTISINQQRQFLVCVRIRRSDQHRQTAPNRIVLHCDSSGKSPPSNSR